MVLRMSSCRPATSAILGLLALTGARPPSSITESSPNARPQVTLILTIERSDYVTSMSSVPCDAPCHRLPEALVDSVRALLESSYTYLNWTTTGLTRDTLHIAWISDVDPTYYTSRVDFRVHSADPAVRLDSYPVAFENWHTVIQRNSTVGGWHPDSVRRAWLPLLDNVILMEDVNAGVFARIPLSATVLFGATREAKVNVAPYELGFDTLAFEAPTFRVRATVTDPQRGTTSAADLLLGDCQDASTMRGYTCTISELQYPPPSNPLTESKLDSLLRVATITNAHLYLGNFKPAKTRREKSKPQRP